MMVDTPAAGTATTGMGTTGIGATGFGAASIQARGIGRAASPAAVGDGTNIRQLHATRSQPARFPWGTVRLAICTGNGAVWVAVCEGLNAGFGAAITAGIIGFASAAMVLGCIHGREIERDE